MPRPRARALFELGGQWIADEPGRVGLYRFWNDAGTGRTRRASLGTSDIEEAKDRLAEIIVKGAPKTVDSYLSLVLEDYYTRRTDHLRTADQARHSGKLFLQCWGDLVKVFALNEDKQKDFIDWSIKKNHALGYIARNLVTLAAALAHAKIAHCIIASEGAIRAKWPDIKPKPRRKPFTPSDVEVARIWAAPMPDNLRRWMLIEMTTGCRPECALDLIPACRDRHVGAVDLNPPERIQNKKYRPKVRETRALTTALNSWELADEKKTAKTADGRYVGYASVDSVDTALWRVCTRPDVNVPNMGVYSFRHKATTVMRLAHVPGEQRSLQLGHRRPDLRVTDGYGEWDGSYLREATAALEKWTRHIMALSKDPKKLRANSHRIPTTSAARRAKAA